MMSNECLNNSHISPKIFSLYIKKVREFIVAQVNITNTKKNSLWLFKSIKVERLLAERPDLETMINYSICHGDFNPYNIYSDGVIDFEHCFHGALGYDVVYSMIHHYLFPKTDEAEINRSYWFSIPQIMLYVNLIDDVYKHYFSSKFADFMNEFILLKFIKSSANTASLGSDFELLQNWRRSSLVMLLDYYFKGEDLLNILMNDPNWNE